MPKSPPHKIRRSISVNSTRKSPAGGEYDKLNMLANKNMAHVNNSENVPPVEMFIESDYSIDVSIA